jgi:ATP/maltotriose-dependent transcriptional regulator MalT
MSVDRMDAAKPFRPIVRPRLSQRLNQAASYRICLIVAPAGYGKSVAMRHFLEASGRQYLRYALGRDNSSLLGFLRGFVDTLDPIAPRSVRSLTSVYERAQRTENPISELASWLAVLLKKYSGLIAIDDLHLAVPEVGRLLVELMSRTSEEVSWIMATRDPLELPVASWLAYGQMDMPIDEVDLKLTFAEALDAAESSGIRMHDSELKMLWELTDGWPTAFAFALRTTTRTQDLKRVAAGTRDMVFSYLAEQILNGVDKDDRDFLLATSVIPEIDLDAFDAVGRTDVEARILKLQKKTSFIAAESTRIFKYHDLFRDFLEHQLRAEGQERYDRALSEGAKLLESASRTGQALTLYCQARDSEAIHRLLSSKGTTLVNHGNIEVVERAAAMLDYEKKATDIRILTLIGDLHVFRGKLGEAATMFRSALAIDGDYADKIETACRFAALLLNQFRFPEASNLLESFDSSAIERRDTLARFLGMLATVRSSIGASNVEQLVGEAVEIASQVDDEAIRAEVLHQAGHVAWRTGNYDEARRLATLAVQSAESQGLYALAARATSVLANIAHGSGDNVRSHWALSQIMRLAERGGDRGAWFYGLANSYDLAAEQNDTVRLGDLDQKLQETAGSDEYRAVAESLLPALALQASWSGDFSGASRLLIGTAANLGTAAHKALRSSEIALYAAAANERDSADEALKAAGDLLAKLSDGPEAITPRVIRAKIWSALAALILGRSAQANKALKDVERDARRLTSGMKSLVALARATYVHVETGAAHSDMARNLDEARNLGFGGYARMVEQLPLPTVSSLPRFASLTKTEIRVLQSLAQGGSSRSIGLELERSSQTVDAHVKSIIKKLGCSGRQEAVKLARLHGIV